MFCFWGASLAKEGQRDLAHRIERRQERSESERDKDKIMSIAKRVGKDLILGPETGGHKWEARKGKATDQECPESNRHLLTQATHVEHVLRIDLMIPRVKHTMFHTMDDRARSQEEQRLEEG